MKSPHLIPIRTRKDALAVFNVIKQEAIQHGMSAVRQTQLLTATSELINNILSHAIEGTVNVVSEKAGSRGKIIVTVTDNGPGIPDIDRAMTSGFSTKGTLGVGLPGTGQIVDEFNIKSTVGQGTIVTIAKWA